MQHYCFLKPGILKQYRLSCICHSLISFRTCYKFQHYPKQQHSVSHTQILDSSEQHGPMIWRCHTSSLSQSTQENLNDNFNVGHLNSCLTFYSTKVKKHILQMLSAVIHALVCDLFQWRSHYWVSYYNHTGEDLLKNNPLHKRNHYLSLIMTKSWARECIALLHYRKQEKNQLECSLM